MGNMPGAPPELVVDSPFAPGGPSPFASADRENPYQSPTHSENPYQSPTEYVDPMQAGYRSADPLAASRVSGPAIAPHSYRRGAAMNLISLVWHIFFVALVPGGVGNGRRNAGDPAMAMFSGVGGIVSGIVGLLLAALVIAGAMKMKKLESYGMAMAAAIIAILPCNCCCVLGLPFGIWALVVLNDAGVKTAFRS